MYFCVFKDVNSENCISISRFRGKVHLYIMYKTSVIFISYLNSQVLYLQWKIIDICIKISTRLEHMSVDEKYERISNFKKQHCVWHFEKVKFLIGLFWELDFVLFE